jgi:RNA polymerase sigma-70 factor, ECF subfamily
MKGIGIKNIAARDPDLTNAEDNALSDEALMAKIAGGDARAFEILVRRHQRRILNLIYRSIGDRTQAEDVAQEVFLRVWRAAENYEPKSKFTTWVYRIAVNLCLDALKERHRKQPFVDVHVGVENPGENDEALHGCDGARSPEELLIDAEESDRIFADLQGLPTNQRLAVVLSKFDGLCYDEISRILGCSVSAVESLLVRAKRTLREKLLAHDS